MRYWIDCGVNKPLRNLYINFSTIKALTYLNLLWVIKTMMKLLEPVHTLKGICQNLSFTRLFESSSLVTKALKENDWNKAVDMMPQLSKDYRETIDVIKDFKKSKEE